VSDKQTNKDKNAQSPSDKNTPSSGQAKKVTKTKGSSKTVGLALIIFLLLGLIGAGGWYGYEFYLQANQTLVDIQRSQTALLEGSQQFEDKLSQRMQAVLKKQKEMVDYVDVLREKNQFLRKDWLLTESEYLIKLAIYRLLFERDVDTAIIALESSDQRLRETGDPGILGVRDVIAKAMQALKQVPQADLTGLSLQLSAINQQIDKLPLATPDPKSAEPQQVNKAGENVKTWSELPAAIWTDLKGLIKVRHHDKPIGPMLAPKERFFLIENLRLQIEQARLAMLSGHPEIYKERLNTAISWITEHFDNNEKITQSTLENLNQLANESIAPTLPDIAYTYQAIQKYRLSQQDPIHKPQSLLETTQQVN